MPPSWCRTCLRSKAPPPWPPPPWKLPWRCRRPARCSRVWRLTPPPATSSASAPAPWRQPWMRRRPCWMRCSRPRMAAPGGSPWQSPPRCSGPAAMARVPWLVALVVLALVRASVPARSSVPQRRVRLWMWTPRGRCLCGWRPPCRRPLRLRTCPSCRRRPRPRCRLLPRLLAAATPRRPAWPGFRSWPRPWRRAWLRCPRRRIRPSQPCERMCTARPMCGRCPPRRSPPPACSCSASAPAPTPRSAPCAPRWHRASPATSPPAPCRP